MALLRPFRAALCFVIAVPHFTSCLLYHNHNGGSSWMIRRSQLQMTLRVTERLKNAQQSSISFKTHGAEGFKGRLGHLRPTLWNKEDSPVYSKSSLHAAMKFKSFEEMLQIYNDTSVLVSFEARWCGPCRVMKKELSMVRNTLGDDELPMFSVDVHKFQKLGERYDVSALPTVLLFHAGVVAERVEGVETADELLQRIQKLTHSQAKKPSSSSVAQMENKLSS